MASFLCAALWQPPSSYYDGATGAATASFVVRSSRGPNTERALRGSAAAVLQSALFAAVDESVFRGCDLRYASFGTRISFAFG